MNKPTDHQTQLHLAEYRIADLLVLVDELERRNKALQAALQAIKNKESDRE